MYYFSIEAETDQRAATEVITALLVCEQFIIEKKGSILITWLDIVMKTRLP